MADIHNALTIEPRTPAEVSAATSDPNKYRARRCERRLLRLMREHPECKIVEASGRFFVKE
jgi:hypothetical protein